MEKDTVLLDVLTYNELRDFKKEIIANNTMVISGSGWTGFPTEKRFISESETVKEIAQENAKLKEQIEELKKPKEQKEPSVYELKRMSYWEFRKWRKS